MRVPIVPAVHFADPQGFHRQIVRLSAATLLHLQSQVLPVSAGCFENPGQRGECAGRSRDQGAETSSWDTVTVVGQIDNLRAD